MGSAWQDPMRVEGGRPVWLNKTLLVELNHKNEVHRGWRWGQATHEEYQDVTWVCRDTSSITDHFWEVIKIRGDSWRWEKGKCHTVFKKNKEILGKYMPVSQTSASRKIMEQILSEGIPRHVTDKKIIGNSQREFSKGNQRLTDLIAFMMKLLALGRRVHKSPTVFFQTNK